MIKIMLLYISIISCMQQYSQDTIVVEKNNKNGELYMKIETIGNKKTITVYFPNGRIYDICHYKDNEIHGIYKSYFENGKVASEIPLINGEKEGIVKFYYNNGNLQEYIEYENNIPIGKHIKYDKNGNIISDTTYYRYLFLKY